MFVLQNGLTMFSSRTFLDTNWPGLRLSKINVQSDLQNWLLIAERNGCDLINTLMSIRITYFAVLISHLCNQEGICIS